MKYGFNGRLSSDFPSQVMVDITEVCNLACIHCTHPKFKESNVYAKAMPLHIGRTTSLWNVEITDEDNNMVCRVTFTAMYKDIKK